MTNVCLPEFPKIHQTAKVHQTPSENYSLQTRHHIISHFKCLQQYI